MFKSVLPVLTEAGICYWVYGGVAIAGINGAYLRPNPDVDVFVVNDDYDEARELVAGLEKDLNWDHQDTQQRERRKREWRVTGNRHDIFSLVPVFRDGDRIRFVFKRDFIPNTVLTSVTRRIGNHRFTTPSTEFIKELFICKVNSGNLSRERRKKLKVDAKAIMNNDEYRGLCDRLDNTET